jgi:hypothetical protein
MRHLRHPPYVHPHPSFASRSSSRLARPSKADRICDRGAKWLPVCFPLSGVIRTSRAIKLLHSLRDEAAGPGGVMWHCLAQGLCASSVWVGAGVTLSCIVLVWACLQLLAGQDSGLGWMYPQISPLCSLHVVYGVGLHRPCAQLPWIA